MRVKAFLLAGALASAGPIAAQDTETRQLTDHQQMVHDIYRDIIGFRTARGHQQVDRLQGCRARRRAASQFRDGQSARRRREPDGGGDA